MESINSAFLSLYTFLCISLCVIGINGKSDYFSCRAKDPSVNECIVKNANIFLKGSTQEFKQLGMPILDPLVIPKMGLHNGNGPVSLNLDILNGKHRGLSKGEITEVKAHPDTHEFEFHIETPEYVIDGKYNVSGKIIMLPITGSGPCHIKFTGVTGIWKFKGDLFEKNNKKYLKISEFQVTMGTKGLSMKLENLFNGNKQLSDTMNKFLNENWEEVFQTLKPSMEEYFQQLLTELANRALSRLEYKTMFTNLS